MNRFNPLDAAVGQLAAAGARQNIVNIIRSYHNGTDVLAEPIQNAVDEVEEAVRSGTIARGSVTVKINQARGEITVSDNGRGMPRDFAQAALAPDVTQKTELFKLGRSRGHKGVGMTFLAYGFDEFELQSRTETDYFKITMRNARSWVEGRDPQEFPMAELEEMDESDGGLAETGVLIRIKVGPNTTPKSIPHAFPTERAARTAIMSGTAIGVLRADPKSTSPSFDAFLEFESRSEAPTRTPVPATYLYPHLEIPQALKVKDVTSDRFNPNLTEPSPKDRKAFRAAYTTFGSEELVELLDGKTGDTFETADELAAFIRAHKVCAYALASAGADYQESLLGSWGVPNLKRRLGAGLRVGTDGMISSWARPLNLVHRGFNVNRIWLVLDFTDVEPDMGRKDFPPDVREVIDLLENPLADKIDKLADPYLLPRSNTGNPIETQPPADKAREHRASPFTRKSLPNFGELGLQSEPQEEQDVIGLFHELRGLGVLKQFEFVFSSSHYAYDGFVEYFHEKCDHKMLALFPAAGPPRYQTEGALEFKLEARSLLADLVNESKAWSDIRFLVCWNLGAETVQLGGAALTFSDTENSSYCGVTHEAQFSDNKESKVFVVALETLLSRIVDG